MTAALYFGGDAYSIAGPKLMGRNAAGASFLRGFLEHSTATRFWLEVVAEQDAHPFIAAARAAGRDEHIDVMTPEGMGGLTAAGTLYFPASNFAIKARHRSLFDDAGWSICGVTHTTASASATDGIVDMLTGAVQPWDALICTSHAVRANVEAVFAAEVEALRRRLGITRVVRPEMPVIPLGIHTGDFVSDGAARADARDAIGADADTMVVLYAGRLSFHAKAHPAAMYAALEQAAQRTGKRVTLVECGWFANGALERSFDQAAAALAPSVTIVRLDGREADRRQVAWAAADIFCSLADNVQETFGLTPIEAMAAGLPVVVSDWDGYRDTVRDGIDGIRVATLAPPPGLGGDLAARHALGVDTYDRYCGYSCSFVAVDVAAAADAFAALFGSADLRQRMGAAGQARARSDYDWRTIIPQYETLWAMLGEIRGRARPVPRQPHPWPARMDTFAAFASYPTRLLTADSGVALVDSNVDAAIVRFRAMIALDMIGFAGPVLPTQAEAEAIIARCGNSAVRAGDLVQAVAPERRGHLFRAIVWLVKIGVIRTTP